LLAVQESMLMKFLDEMVLLLDALMKLVDLLVDLLVNLLMYLVDLLVDLLMESDSAENANI